MQKTTATEFERKCSEFQERAEHEPLEIIRQGKADLALITADHYNWRIAAARRSHKTLWRRPWPWTQ